MCMYISSVHSGLVSLWHTMNILSKTDKHCLYTVRIYRPIKGTLDTGKTTRHPQEFHPYCWRDGPFSQSKSWNVRTVCLKHLRACVISWVRNLLDIVYMSLVSRDSDWLRAGRLRGWGSSPGRVKIYYFSISSRPALGSTQPPIQWVPGALSRG
jgi:hypothetical protein